VDGRVLCLILARLVDSPEWIGTAAIVSVTDRGVGFSAENADRLFTAFFNTKSNGMGMGLSICRSIIEAHNGRLWATANLSHGATFQFTLPAGAGSKSVNLGR
jgi:signal transduction histidine kinase